MESKAFKLCHHKMITKISQSFMKDYRAYQLGDECGNMIREKYVNDRLFDDEESPGAMNLGAFFEYNLSGAIPKNGKIPMPVMMADGKTMRADYRKAVESAKIVKDYLQAMGLKIVYIAKQYDNGRFTGVIDLVVEVTRGTVHEGIEWKVGMRFVIDLKYSGLIGKTGDKSNKHGWGWSEVQKEYHGTQAKQYHFISGLPFYFLVTQSNQEESENPIVRLFYIPVDDYLVRSHVAEGNAMFDHFSVKAAVNDFKPYPSLKRCSKCPIRHECDDKHTYPRLEIVYLTAE